MVTLSLQQLSILRAIRDTGAPLDPPNSWGHVRISHLPGTGDVIVRLGRTKTEVAYASVSRSLARLNKAGLVHGMQATVMVQGKGQRWQITPAGIAALAATEALSTTR